MKSKMLFVLAVILLMIAIWQNTTLLYILACGCVASAIPLLLKKVRLKINKKATRKGSAAKGYNKVRLSIGHYN